MHHRGGRGRAASADARASASRCCCCNAAAAPPPPPCRVCLKAQSSAEALRGPPHSRQEAAAAAAAAAACMRAKRATATAEAKLATVTDQSSAENSAQAAASHAYSLQFASFHVGSASTDFPTRTLRAPAAGRLSRLCLFLLYLCFSSSFSSSSFFYPVAYGLPLRALTSAALSSDCDASLSRPCRLFGSSSAAAPIAATATPPPPLPALLSAASSSRAIAEPAFVSSSFSSSPAASRSVGASSSLTANSLFSSSSAVAASSKQLAERPTVLLRPASRTAAAKKGGRVRDGGEMANASLLSSSALWRSELLSSQTQRPRVIALDASAARLPPSVNSAGGFPAASRSAAAAAAGSSLHASRATPTASLTSLSSSAVGEDKGAAATASTGDENSKAATAAASAPTAAAAPAAIAAAGAVPAAEEGKQLVSPYVAQMLYEDMLLGRGLEDACFRLYYQGKTAGFVHLYTGQEAVSSGVIKLLRQDDAVVSTYRDHVHASSKGVPPEQIMAELFGKSTGCSKGRGGSMHMFSKKYNLIGGFAFIGEQIPIALGYAFSAAYRRFALSPTTAGQAATPASAAGAAAAAGGATAAGGAASPGGEAVGAPPAAATAGASLPGEMQHDQVTVCFLGDGTTNIGQLWEALNIAALAKLPVIFVVENNNWAIGMAAQRSTAIPRVWQRAETFGVAGVEVDGMDVLAVRSVARRAVQRARRGEGPTLIEALTYRFRGHSVADPDEMRAPKQKEAWVVRDPILAFEEQLKALGFATEDTIRQTRQKVFAVIEKAVQFAEKSVESPVRECGSYIFAPPYSPPSQTEEMSDKQLQAYATALKEELDWKARLKAGDRTPRPPVTQAFKPSIVID